MFYHRIALVGANPFQSEAEPTVIDMMARANPGRLGELTSLNHMDQQALRAMLAQAEMMVERIRSLLQPAPSAAPTASSVPALPSPTAAEPTEKSPARAVSVAAISPAPTSSSDEEVPPMTQGEKTPVLPGGTSPAPVAEEDGVEEPGPATPPSKTGDESNSNGGAKTVVEDGGPVVAVAGEDGAKEGFVGEDGQVELE